MTKYFNFISIISSYKFDKAVFIKLVSSIILSRGLLSKGPTLKYFNFILKYFNFISIISSYKFDKAVFIKAVSSIILSRGLLSKGPNFTIALKQSNSMTQLCHARILHVNILTCDLISLTAFASLFSALPGDPRWLASLHQQDLQRRRFHSKRHSHRHQGCKAPLLIQCDLFHPSVTDMLTKFGTSSLNSRLSPLWSLVQTPSYENNDLNC